MQFLKLGTERVKEHRSSAKGDHPFRKFLGLLMTAVCSSDQLSIQYSKTLKIIEVHCPCTTCRYFVNRVTVD